MSTSMSLQSKFSGLFKHINSDFPASIVVFFVALPLCLGIALASGAPLFSGVIAGIVGGIVVGIASGSQLGVRWTSRRFGRNRVICDWHARFLSSLFVVRGNRWGYSVFARLL